MKFIAEIDVMPLKNLLDPQGKTVANNLPNVGIEAVSDVRIGKHVRMELDASDQADAKTKVDTACKKLLSNPVMEQYSFEITTA